MKKKVCVVINNSSLEKIYCAFCHEELVLDYPFGITHCPHCGEPNALEFLFTCPNEKCHAAVLRDEEVCPTCNTKLYLCRYCKQPYLKTTERKTCHRCGNHL